MTRTTILVVSCGLLLGACADAVVAPPIASPPEQMLPSTRAAGVAAAGVLRERRDGALLIEQRGFDLTPAPDLSAQSTQHPAIGKVGTALQVLIDPSTQIYVAGSRAPLHALPLGTHVIVAGVAEGAALRASVVGDLSGMRAPPSAQVTARDQPGSAIETSTGPALSADELSLCIGQLMDYFLDETVYEFHGCWGGPSLTHTIDFEPNVPIGCNLLGCWVVDTYTFTYALGGSTFDFPFRFTASSPGLTYHVPGPVDLHLTSLPATGPGFTYTGGIGFNLAFNFDFCFFITRQCHDVHTVNFSDISLIQQTKGPGPVGTSQRLDVAETACPGVGLIAIPGTPFEALELGLCLDLSFTGQPYEAKTTFQGGRAPNDVPVSFEGNAVRRTVTPDALFVDVSHHQFSWAPDMAFGFYVRLDLLGVTILESPRVPIGDGPFHAVSTPFPFAPLFTLATDPQSPDLLYQPLRTKSIRIPVARAPTTLAIISPPVLDEGSPLEARLTESYDGSPITVTPVRFIVTSADGTHHSSGTTDGGGIARLTLPTGEHEVTVHFDGTPFYLPSSASQRVLVYRPTTFVIWGGNAGGIAPGARYQFWGSQWHTQVTGGAFTGNASFKGYAHTVVGTSWIAGGGNSTQPPDDMVEFIGVLVSTVITKQGPNTVGNVASRVILRVDDPASYRPNPGHAGFGRVWSTIPPP